MASESFWSFFSKSAQVPGSEGLTEQAEAPVYVDALRVGLGIRLRSRETPAAIISANNGGLDAPGWPWYEPVAGPGAAAGSATANARRASRWVAVRLYERPNDLQCSSSASTNNPWRRGRKTGTELARIRESVRPGC